MSFGIFSYSADLDAIVLLQQSGVETLLKLRARIGNGALPQFLIEYIRAASPERVVSLAIHTASSIVGSRDADQTTISRDKGFMGKSQLEPTRFPDAVHHVKIFYNKKNKAKLFYKFQGSLQFVQNLKGA
jgi:hypothetical protein